MKCERDEYVVGRLDANFGRSVTPSRDERLPYTVGCRKVGRGDFQISWPVNGASIFFAPPSSLANRIKLSDTKPLEEMYIRFVGGGLSEHLARAVELPHLGKKRKGKLMGNDGSQPTKKKEEDESWIVSSDVTAAAVPSSAGSLTLLYSLLCLLFFY